MVTSSLLLSDLKAGCCVRTVEVRRLWFWEAGNVTEESYGLWLVLSTYLLDPVTPFVKVGDKVQKSQVVCIIEAMKLMNEIEV
ncbi:hypothetical protein DY000_02054301 [Brassica cretica]|uniref:Biotin carboxyl carrier protein of acetyl-CoA carboxylase n=1 Tax=Brassica cretica TaxID=69181 RepID=A0ABQ7A7H2_BRACR|nr:hypothetical protein DY000_02054301 [Brassica cretica]